MMLPSPVTTTPWSFVLDTGAVLHSFVMAWKAAKGCSLSFTMTIEAPPLPLFSPSRKDSFVQPRKLVPPPPFLSALGSRFKVLVYLSHTQSYRV